MKTSVMDSDVRVPDEPEAHAVPRFMVSSFLSRCLLPNTLAFFFNR